MTYPSPELIHALMAERLAEAERRRSRTPRFGMPIRRRGWWLGRRTGSG